MVSALLTAGAEVAIIGHSGDARRRHDEWSVVTEVNVDVFSDDAVAFVEAWAPSVIIHLAGVANVRAVADDPTLDAATCVLGAIRLLQAARHQDGDVHVILASTSQIYDFEVQPAPVDEEAPFVADPSPYVINRQAVIRYAAWYDRDGSVTTSVLVLGNVYGELDRESGGIVTAAARQMVIHQPAILWDGGNQTRDFIYIDDVAQAFVRAAQTRARGVFNVGTGIDSRAVDVVQQLHEHFPGAPSSKVARSDLAGPTRVGLLSGKALEYLLWHPKTSLHDGLGRVAAWFRASAAPPSP